MTVDRLGLLADAAVRSALARELGAAVEYHERIGSTQDRARELCEAGAPPTIVVAEDQTTGHGRQGRPWVAPARTALLTSFLLRPLSPEPGVFALLAGVAVARALARCGAADARLKWPNDVQLRGRKVAGVLADAVTAADGGALILGIGINVRQSAAELGDLAGIATSLTAEGHDVDRLALLARLTAELARIAGPAGERRAGLEEWRARSSTLGREVEVRAPGGEAVRGLARAIADDGALVVDTVSGPRVIVAGEVGVVA